MSPSSHSFFRFILLSGFYLTCPIFKKSFFSYSPFLWMGFKCLKAIDPQQGGTLLFTTKLPLILSFPKKLFPTICQFSSIDSKL